MSWAVASSFARGCCPHPLSCRSLLWQRRAGSLQGWRRSVPCCRHPRYKWPQPRAQMDGHGSDRDRWKTHKCHLRQPIIDSTPTYKASVVVERLSYLTETVLENHRRWHPIAFSQSNHNHASKWLGFYDWQITFFDWHNDCDCRHYRQSRHQSWNVLFHHPWLHFHRLICLIQVCQWSHYKLIWQ